MTGSVVGIRRRRTVAGRRENPNLPLDKGRKMLLAAEVAIGKVLKKEGDKLDYLYDFGDGNEIAITNLGAVSGFDVADFASVGPDLVLKRCDLLRKRRLGDMQARRRPREAAFLGDRQKISENAKFHTPQSTTCIYKRQLWI